METFEDLILLKNIPVLIFLLGAMIFFLPAGIVEIYRIIRNSLSKRKIRKEVRRKVGKDSRKRKEREKLGYLLFRDIFGAGILLCKECGHQEEIVHFLHNPFFQFFCTALLPPDKENVNCLINLNRRHEHYGRYFLLFFGTLTLL